MIPLGTGMPGPQSSRSERARGKACGTSRSVKYLGEAAFFGAAAKTWRAWVAWLSACSWACPSTAVARRRVKWTSRRRPTFAIRTLGATAHLFVFRKEDGEALLPWGFFYPHTKQVFYIFAVSIAETARNKHFAAKQTFRAFSYLDLLWCGDKLTVRDFPDKLLVM